MQRVRAEQERREARLARRYQLEAAVELAPGDLTHAVADLCDPENLQRNTHTHDRGGTAGELRALWCWKGSPTHLSHQVLAEVGRAKELGGLVVGGLAGRLMFITAAQEQVAKVAGLRLGQFQVVHGHCSPRHQVADGCIGAAVVDGKEEEENRRAVSWIGLSTWLRVRKGMTLPSGAEWACGCRQNYNRAAGAVG